MMRPIVNGRLRQVIKYKVIWFANEQLHCVVLLCLTEDEVLYYLVISRQISLVIKCHFNYYFCEMY